MRDHKNEDYRALQSHMQIMSPTRLRIEIKGLAINWFESKEGESQCRDF